MPNTKSDRQPLRTIIEWNDLLTQSLDTGDTLILVVRHERRLVVAVLTGSGRRLLDVDIVVAVVVVLEDMASAVDRQVFVFMLGARHGASLSMIEVGGGMTGRSQCYLIVFIPLCTQVGAAGNFPLVVERVRHTLGQVQVEE